MLTKSHTGLTEQKWQRRWVNTCCRCQHKTQMLHTCLFILQWLRIPCFTHAINSEIPPFCIKLQEYKIMNIKFLSQFLIVSNSLHLSEKSKILKSARCSSCDCMLILICHVKLGIYTVYGRLSGGKKRESNIIIEKK